MTRSVLWDASAILALLDADDEGHARAVGVARQLASEKRPAFITNYIEAHALLLRKPARGTRPRRLKSCQQDEPWRECGR